MIDRMKILIAYDGSECADSALDDLASAGLPHEAEVLLFAVLDYRLPLSSSFGLGEAFLPDAVLKGEDEILDKLTEATRRINARFPGWDVGSETMVGVPASTLIYQADEWKPDLTVVGSHGRSALGRFFLGSVSQRLVNESHHSVRVARWQKDKPEAPVRIIAGVDGSKGSEQAVRAIADREWPPGTEVRIVNGAWSVPPITYDHLTGPVAEWIARENAKVKEAIDASIAALLTKGLITATVIKEEDPKKLLCEEAESWGADCIFVGAKGAGKLERFLVGSVSSSVAARAHCSVEIVRK
jgi:nucleotide-binding universal stress UspA family protein